MTDAVATGRDSWRLVCSELTVCRGGQAALHDVSFDLPADECVSLIGPNGSGKTTLMLAMLGLLPPAAGSVCLGGVPMQRLSPRHRARYASYVPQVVERIPAFRVRDVVAGGRYAHVSPLRPLSDSDQQVVERALEQCGLGELSERPINAISGGERQKTLIAAAIAQDAHAMFLDEPNTALDPAVQVELVRLLQAWHRAGRGIVLISHDLNLPAALGGRVIALRGGRTVADGPADGILRPERLAEIYETTFEAATTADGRRVALPRWW